MTNEKETESPVAAVEPSYRVKSISVSLELSNKDYGTGMSHYANIQAYVDDAGLDQINDVIEGGLMLYVAAWRTLMAGQLVTKLGAMCQGRPAPADAWAFPRSFYKVMKP